MIIGTRTNWVNTIRSFPFCDESNEKPFLVEKKHCNVVSDLIYRVVHINKSIDLYTWYPIVNETVLCNGNADYQNDYSHSDGPLTFMFVYFPQDLF